MTHCYEVYGAGFSTTMAFPELRESADLPVKWEFDAVAELPPMQSAVELGFDTLYADVQARLFRHADGHRITVDDTGSFDIAADGRRVRWQERAESWPDFVRAHFMGRVLATTMYLDGWLPLHGSAVALKDGVVAFLAPKGFGKSSLALALTQQGARLVTDDTLPVQLTACADGEPLERPLAWPGVHSLRVRDDAVSALGVDAPDLETREGKWLVTDIPPEQRTSTCQPLAGIYVLAPVSAENATSAATRTLLPSMLSAIGVVAHVKIGRMLGTNAAATMLKRAATITGSVPVHQLHAARDLALLPEVAASIIGWHGGVA